MGYGRKAIVMATAKTRATKTVSKKPKKAGHGTSVDTAFRRIRDLIVEGRLAPGTWIVEGDLCEHLHMSRTPVRGALYLLLREGYVNEYRNGSKSRMIVTPLTLEDANDLYPIISRIEGLSGRRAAKLPDAERLELAEKLKAINSKLKQIASEREMTGSSIFDLDCEFHSLIVKAGASPRLTAMHHAIEPQTERYWRLYASAILQDLYLSTEEHEAIIAALIKGYATALEQAIWKNWENGCQRLARVIEVFGERGSWQTSSQN